VRVISKAKLREFWSKYPKTEAPLNAWHRVAEKAEWSSPLDVRNTYRSADPVGDQFVVFDICNNEYRLVVRVDYNRAIVYIWDVYTHSDYDGLDLKAIDEKIRREQKQREADRGR
jgi:mRNA interferase HigB